MNSNTHQMDLSIKPFYSVPSLPTARTKHAGCYLLLRMSISKRLALGFLIPILVILLALGSIGIQSYQLLTNVSTYNQHLLHAYTSLTAEVGILQQTHTNVLGAVNDANKSQTTQETLREDRTTIQRLEVSYDTTLKDYLQHDVLASYPELSALLKAAGHGSQIDEQRVRSNKVLKTWQAYQDSLAQIFEAIAVGDLGKANTLETTQAEQAYGDAMTSLLLLIQFTNGLVPSIHEAIMVEENQLLFVMACRFSAFCLG